MSKVPDKPAPFSVATAGHDDPALCLAHADPTNIVGRAPLCQNIATHRVEVADPIAGGINGGEFAPATTLTRVCDDHLAVIQAAGALIAAQPIEPVSDFERYHRLADRTARLTGAIGGWLGMQAKGVATAEEAADGIRRAIAEFDAIDAAGGAQ